MKSVFDLDNSDRVYWSALVRDQLSLASCSSRTWAKYRLLAGVPSGERYLTQREAFLLWACSLAARRRGITKGELLKIATRLLNNGAKFELPPGELTAEQLREALGKMLGLGAPISERTLYRWGAGNGTAAYSRKKTYSHRQLMSLMACGEKIAS